MTREKLQQDIAAFLAAGGQIQQVDSSYNADADTRFFNTNAGPRYADKALAKERQTTHNKRRGN